MEYFYFELLNLSKTIFSEVSDILVWFKSPFFNGLSPLLLFSIGGLTIYIGIALVKWLVN